MENLLNKPIIVTDPKLSAVNNYLVILEDKQIIIIIITINASMCAKLTFNLCEKDILSSEIVSMGEHNSVMIATSLE